VVCNSDIAAIATRCGAAGTAGTTRAGTAISACAAIAAIANGQVGAIVSGKGSYRRRESLIIDLSNRRTIATITGRQGNVCAVTARTTEPITTGTAGSASRVATERRDLNPACSSLQCQGVGTVIDRVGTGKDRDIAAVATAAATPRAAIAALTGAATAARTAVAGIAIDRCQATSTAPACG
jgi:hypothetical protein